MASSLDDQEGSFTASLKRWLSSLPSKEKGLLSPGEGLYAFAPGRGNLIGEHIDYSGGTVSPVTIGPGCFCAAIPRSDRAVTVANLAGEVAEGAARHSATVSLPLEKLFSGGRLIPEERARSLLAAKDAWAGLIIGALYVLMEEGHLRKDDVRGTQYAVKSEVPIASGLSSSAALEVSALAATAALNGLSLSGADLARLGQRMEHAMRGVPCGRMDQSAAALGRPNEVLSLDCTTWQAAWHILPKGWSALFIDTRVPRSLATSAYAERRAACEHGLVLINAKRASPVKNLCSLSPKEFARDAAKARLDPVTLKRCRHAVDEQARVREFLTLLERGKDVERLGELLYASHDSLRNLYEVSCPELDAVAAIARTIGLNGGVAGARMQGAGFGGCAVALVREDAIQAVKRILSSEYLKRTGKECAFVSGSSPGAVAFGTRSL